jgi:hypothetical protein
MISERLCFKGTVARDFGLWVFSWIDPIWTSDSYPEICSNSVSNSLRYSNLKVVPRGLIPRRNLFRGVWYSTGIFSVGYDTPQEFVPLGIRPRRNLFRGVSDPAEQEALPLCSLYLSVPSTPVSPVSIYSPLSPCALYGILSPLRPSVPLYGPLFPSTTLCPLNPFVPSTPLSPLRLCPLYSFVPATPLSPLILCTLYGPLSRRQIQHRTY